MTVDLYLALMLFAFVTSATPGPNNLMLLTSGVNFGFRRSIPHMFGIGIGFCFMVAVIGLGLGQMFERYPQVYSVLKYAGGLYMVYLAWKFASTRAIGEGKSTGHPMTFAQAVAFQWVNPKAWVMAITATTTYALPQGAWWPPILVAATFGLVNIPSVSMWAGFGTALRSVLGNPAVLRIFNITMALLLLVSLWPMLSHH
jgi:threonine/homoserine/homoserine lactone efflux protein